MRNLPHLTYLEAFEAAARHLSFTRAAEELNCTKGRSASGFGRWSNSSPGHSSTAAATAWS